MNELVVKITGKRYQKVGGSRAIGRHLNLDNLLNIEES